MIRFFLAISFFIFSSLTTWGVDSFLPYQSAEEVPKTAKELWAAYDSTKEDLDVKVIKEWKEDGVIIRYLTYKVGTFKGTDARVAAYYSFPFVAQARQTPCICMDSWRWATGRTGTGQVLRHPRVCGDRHQLVGTPDGGGYRGKYRLGKS